MIMFESLSLLLLLSRIRAPRSRDLVWRSDRDPRGSAQARAAGEQGLTGQDVPHERRQVLAATEAYGGGG